MLSYNVVNKWKLGMQKIELQIHLSVDQNIDLGRIVSLYK